MVLCDALRALFVTVGFCLYAGLSPPCLYCWLPSRGSLPPGWRPGRLLCLHFFFWCSTCTLALNFRFQVCALIAASCNRVLWGTHLAVFKVFSKPIFFQAAACPPAVPSASSRRSLLIRVRVVLAHVASSPLGDVFGRPRVGFARFTSTFKF